MNGKRAKVIRRLAEGITVSEPAVAYNCEKNRWGWYQHPRGNPVAMVKCTRRYYQVCKHHFRRVSIATLTKSARSAEVQSQWLERAEKAVRGMR